MAIIGIVCVDNQWGIGKDNNLLFSIPEDMQFFKDTTMGKSVCMGYNTLLSLPNSKPLKGRFNFVLCPEGIEFEGYNILALHDFNQILKIANDYQTKNKDLYIIGGAMLYESMLPYYDKVLVTKVNTNGNATVFFPNLDENKQFTITSKSDIIKTNNDYNIQFIEYRRLKDEN